MLCNVLIIPTKPEDQIMLVYYRMDSEKQLSIKFQPKYIVYVEKRIF